MTEVRVSLGRSNVVVTVFLLLMLGGATGVMALVAAQSQGGTAKVLAVVLAVVFGVPVLLMFWALPRLVAERFVVFDGQGLRLVHHKDEVLLAWPQIAAVGVGYRRPAGERGLDGVREALELSDGRKLALEVFPAAPEVAVTMPKLLPYWKQLPPPVPSLPWWRWTFRVPPAAGVGQRIADGVRVLQPGRWLGWFARS